MNIRTVEDQPNGRLEKRVTGAIIVLTFVFRRNGGEEVSVGDIFLIGTVVAGALGYAFSGRLSVLMPAWEAISRQVVILLPLAALAIFALWPVDIASVSIASLAALGYVGFVSQFTVFFVFNAAMAMGGIAPHIGQVMLLQPFVIVALALPVNGELISIETILFAVAVVATVLVGQRTRVARRRVTLT